MLAYWKLLMRNRVAALRPARKRKLWQNVLMYGASGLGLLLLYAMVVGLELALYMAATAMGDPLAVLALMTLGCSLVTLIYGFFYVTSVLYFSRDNAFVGALPISSRGVMTAKLANVLLGEIGLTLLICAPMLICHGVMTRAGVGYYLRALVGVVCLPVAPVAVAALLSSLLIRVSALWKRREGVTIVASFLLMGVIVGAEMALQGVDEDRMGEFIMDILLGRGGLSKLFLSYYPPLKWLAGALTGAGAAAWGGLALFAGYSAALMAGVIALCGGGYLRLALRQEEARARLNVGKRRVKGARRARSPFMALYLQEMREVLTVTAYATNCLTGVVMFPVLVIALLMGMRSEMGVANIASALLGLVPRDVILAAMAGFLSLTAVMGMAISTAVSREGKHHEFRRVFPVSGATQLGAKLLMGFTFNAVAAVTTAAALVVMMPQFWLEALAGLAVSQLFSLLWCAMSLLVDVYRPKLTWETEAEAVKQSGNSVICMLAGLVMMLALCGVAALAWCAGAPVWAAVLMVVGVMLALAALMLKWLLGRGAEVYSLRENAAA